MSLATEARLPQVPVAGVEDVTKRWRACVSQMSDVAPNIFSRDFEPMRGYSRRAQGVKPLDIVAVEASVRQLVKP